ncbi:amino acid adenylation domain-containing protein [Pseudomonas putida]|uniref:amino acid adenylation domain-containing protein n=1 Tax=Pseudomonas putida TaxID=303 RepID=UPI0030CDE0EB
MQELLESVKLLSTKERLALAALLKQQGVNLYGVTPIFKRDPEGPVPLSYAQRRQWFLWQLEPAAPTYNIPAALRLQGLLDVDALKRSFDALIARHETLRTTFSEEGERTVQVIHPAQPLVLDIQALQRADEQVVREQVEAEARRPFDLQQGPLLRVKLLRLAQDEHVLMLTMHHIVSDGWSMPVMIDELMQLYAGYSQGQEVQLPALAVQYADYAIWQRQWMEAGEQERQLTYWKSALGDDQPVLELPTDRPRPVASTYRGARHEIRLPENLVHSLKQLAHQQGATLFMLLLASFQTLLHRYSGQSDIRVGVPVANRNRVETERLIGFFVNTQVLRAEFDLHMTFSELLQQVKQRALGAQSHQDLPFEQLVDALQPERSLSHSPLFQVMYNHQMQAKGKQRSVHGLHVEGLTWNQDTAKFDLTLDTFEFEHSLGAALSYATDLFDAATIEQMAQHWVNLLEAIVRQPGQRVLDLPLTSLAQQRQTVQAWNPALTHFPVEQTLHQLIEAQVEIAPNAVALAFGEQAMSYSELNRRANQLAHKLLELGAGPDVLVGLAVERGLEMVIGLLGILKAGAAYVPLDPEYPQDRLAYMFEDSGIRLLLTQQHLRHALPVPEGVCTLVLDGETGLNSYSEANPARQVSPDNLAYVIYTSGSTGKPKGTLLPHRNVVRLFAATRHWFHFDASDVWTVFHSYAFDFSVWELYGALLYGGKAVIVPKDVARSSEDFHALLVREQVTVLNQTPSAFKPLIPIACEAAKAGQGLALRHVVFGGEALEVSSLKPWFDVFGDRQPRMINMYGITETTVHVTYRPITLDDLHKGASSPIGEVIPDLSWYLLDAALSPIMPGCTGEMLIGQAGLARGYHGRPGLTAERFVPNPFDDNGGRLYRSGDLARYRTDGVIEYIGRIDHQVKIRGFRIELGEIEARLLEQPAVRQVAVLAVDGPSGKQLVGYVVPVNVGAVQGAEQQAVLRDRLRGELKASLPEHMVPAHLLFLEQLPLTGNGKLDRKALPAPDASLLQGEYVAPQTRLEQQIAAIWADVLKLEKVGLADNFFELGGDSIMSLQVVSRARQQGIQFTPKELFQHQTVQGLAGIARRETGTAIDQGRVEGSMPLTPIQQWFFESDIVERHHWNQSVMLKTSETLDELHLQAALACVLEHHDALRLHFDQVDGAWQAVFGTSQQALLWRRQVAHAEALEQVGNEAQRSLNLEHGPLLRAVLGDLPDGSQRLLLIIHHLVVDGVSWRVLLEDLQQAYQSLAAGQAPVLLAKTSAFKAWAEQLQGYATGPALQQELAYWQDQLQGVDDDLPCDHPQGANLERCATSVVTRLDAQWTHKLLQEAPAAYRTQINDLLLTALARVIARWTGGEKVLVRLEGHGREDLFDGIDLTRTVGWFTSMYPLKLSPQAQWADSIKTIKEQLRAVPNKGIGYGVLRYLAGEEVGQTLGQLPKGEIVFNYLGQFDSSFDAATGLLTPAQESGGQGHDDATPLGSQLAINGQVFGGELKLSWSYSHERFEQSTVQQLADDYAEELKALVEHCCQAQNRGITPSDFPLAGLTQAQLDNLPVAAAQIADVYPLSPMQQGMLFHSLYEEGSGNYINQMRVDVDNLDAQRFKQAWLDVLAAHDILRTGFVWQGELERAVQIVRRAVDSPFIEVDWRDNPLLETSLQALADEERQRGFDLAEAPLLRLVLVRIEEHRHHLIYTNHHILMDGWSTSRLLGEVLQRYAGQSMPSQATHYRDYIAWLQRQDAGAAEAFWKGQLAELEVPTYLAQSVQRTGLTRSASGQGEYHQRFDREQTQQIEAFAKANRVTVNTLLQSVWLLLLQRYTGQPTVCFGATVAGRPTDLPGVEEQIGLFINTLPVVGTPRPEQTVAQWVAQVQASNLAAREFEHSPLYEVQRWAGQGGDALFDSLLVFENYPVSEALQQGAPGGLRFGEVANREQTNYPLTLLVSLGTTLSIQYSHNRSHWGEQAIERVARHLSNLLTNLVEHAGQPLAELALQSQQEQWQQLRDWNATVAPFPGENSIHQLIEAQVFATPDAPALVFGEQTLSYAELNRRANQLAHKLRELGVGPDVLVGIAMERSLEMVIGLLGIVKAGGAYVPLDPEYPQDRLAYMFADSGIGLLLTQSHLRDNLPIPAGLRSLDLDVEDLSGFSDANPAVDVAPLNLAYVIYTSGSTGRPKGAGNSHQALVNRLWWMQKAYGLDASDSVLQKTPFSFDVSVWEFFWPLMTGARLVVAQPGAHRDPQLLVDTINHHGISTLHFVPSMLQAFMTHEAVESCTSLKRVMCSGEALPAELARQTLQRLPAAGLYNLYGPTEAAIDVTHWTCQPDESISVPIGQPIDNLKTHILEGSLQPAVRGSAGELYLGGVGLARGYHQRPSLTAERFVPDPFSDNGGRLYRTGDLARYRADGVIDYAGRIDHQVKIRGLRIELGEIEARLLELPSVQEAVVLAQDGPSGKQLVGYVVPADSTQDEGVLRDSLREALKAGLPDYMVPAHLLLLDKLPVTPNGKLDRKALPQPDASQLQGEYVAPQSELEQQIAAIWADVLKLERVGLSDNFFELGGDSIVSLRLVSLGRKAGIHFTPKELFEHQTVHSLALIARRNADEAQDKNQIAAMPHDALGALTQAQREQLPVPVAQIADLYPLSPMQQGMLFYTLQGPEAGLYINQTAVSVAGLEIDRFADAWRQVIARHDILRTAFWSSPLLDEPMQLVLHDVALPLQVLDWRQQDCSADALKALAAEDAAQGFQLTSAPLMRLTLVRLDDGRLHLIWTRHHILMDGWSDSRLLGEVLQTYHGQAFQRPVSRYGNYIRWLGDQPQEKLERFWGATTSGLETPTLLADAIMPRPDRALAGHAALYLRWDAQKTQRLREQAQRLRVTPNTLIQGAWLLVLQRYTGQSTVCFGATVAGRPPSLEGADEMLGLFINTLPVVQAPEPEQRVDQWLQQLQAYNIELRDHEHAALANVQRWAGRPGQPLFDSIVVFENFPVDERLTENSTDSLTFGDVSARGVTNYAMDLCVELGNTLMVEFMYLRNCFTEAATDALRGSFERLLGAMLDEPQATLGSLDMLTPAQMQLAYSRNGMAGSSPCGLLLAEQIALHAKTCPDAVAVVCAAQQLTYGQLERRANRLAHQLIAMGARPETAIGIALERSVEVIVAFLAVMKAGAAYVPLDIDYPQERLQWIVDDANMHLLITTSGLRKRFTQVEHCVELDVQVLDSLPVTPPQPSQQRDHLAYLIYTSGSTGKPKGVAVSHEQIRMHCQAIAALYEMDRTTRELLFMSFAFDGAQERWLSTLSSGGCLVVRDNRLWTAQETWQVLHEQGITIACFPPAYLQQLAEFAEGQEHAAPPVRIYCFGGDAVPNALFEQVKRSLRPQWLTNGYGPTETVVTPLLWKVSREQACEAVYAPIGERVGERTLYVLDQHLNPLPDGVAGELYIGGEGVARGYYQRPSLTAERFVADPFSQGLRLYRTGDRVRRRADGVIDFIGRMDNQLKIRGFRIEPGEIEARLRDLSEVKDAVVVARESTTGKQLIGYVVPHEQACSAQALREALSAELPDYMVPAQLVLMPALPLTPNGKIDRNALPAPEFVGQRAQVAPRNAIERALAEIWQQVLDIPSVGVEDNFFELGGDSLRVLKMLSKVRACEALPIELKLRDVIARPTIAELSGYSDKEASLDPVLLLNSRVAGVAPLFCLHAGFGTVFDYEPLARRLEGRCAVYGIQCRMLLDHTWVDDSIQAMAIDYAQYIRQKQPEGPYQLVGWSLGGSLAVLVANELESQGQKVSMLSLVDSFIPQPGQVGPDADWGDDLQGFLSVILGVDKQRLKVPTVAAGCDSAGLERVIEAVRVAQPKLSAYAEIGSAELAHTFVVAMRLKALSQQMPALPGTAADASCWWAGAGGFEGRIAGNARHIGVDAGHYDILKHREVLDGLSAMVAVEDKVSG